MKQLNELVVGDEVTIRRVSYETPNIVKIKRLTPTLLVAGGMRFNRETGRMVGETVGWFNPSVTPVTEHHRLEVLVVNTRARLRDVAVTADNARVIADFLDSLGRQ